MKRCSLREWIPILPIPVWPLAWQCLLGQNTVAGSMICSFWLCVEACQEEYVGIPIFITSAFHHGSRQRYPAHERHNHRAITVKETIMTDDTIRDQHDHIQDEPPAEGIKRRHVLACMAWAGTGLVWTLAGGLLSSRTLGQAAAEQLAAG